MVKTVLATSLLVSVTHGITIQEPQVAPSSAVSQSFVVTEGLKRFLDKYPCTRSCVVNNGFPGMFDWEVARPRDFERIDIKKNPRSVFSTTHLGNIETLVDTLEKYHSNESERVDRFAYFTGDMMISKLDTRTSEGMVARIRHAFPGGVFWQAYDVKTPGFTAAPDGINGMYMAPAWDVAQELITNAALDRATKPKQVLAAWGSVHPTLDDAIPARKKLHAWVGTAPANAAGVEHHSFPPREYWREMAKYRFMISPRGGGIQSPKNDEALLVLTIPISTREGPFRGGPKKEAAFDGLVDLGWPMVVLDEWDEITKENLDKWWTELSPRLISFRTNCLTSEGFWRIISGQVKYCE